MHDKYSAKAHRCFEQSHINFKQKISLYFNATQSHPNILQILLLVIIKYCSKTLQYSTNTVIYCKRGYFRWGKISRKCWQDISRGGNFHDTTPISFIKAYGFYFRVGVIFAKKTRSRKTRKLPPRENFHVYSIAQRHISMLEILFSVISMHHKYCSSHIASAILLKVK